MNPVIIAELVILVLKLLLAIFGGNPSKVAEYLTATDWPWIARPFVRFNRRREMLKMIRTHTGTAAAEYRDPDVETGAIKKLSTLTAADVERIAQL